MRSVPFAFAAASLLKTAAAVQVLGPVSTLNIANGFISPDGYSRNAVLAGGSFPGPVITGQPVRPSHPHES
jgi:iron transport multicopper oxidase